MPTPLFNYIYIDVKDYTNRPSLSTYTLDITPLYFYPDLSTSTVLSGGAYLANKNVKWDFGDGTQSYSLTAEHRYKWPGKYNVNLTVYDSKGNSYENIFVPSIDVYNIVEDDINFRDYGKFIYDVPASKIIDPLVVQRTNSFQTYEALSGGSYTVFLYASGALGSYIDLNSYYSDKYSHLRSLSRFYEKQIIGNTESFTIVDAVSTIDTKVFVRIENNRLQLCKGLIKALYLQAQLVMQKFIMLMIELRISLQERRQFLFLLLLIVQSFMINMYT